MCTIRRVVKFGAISLLLASMAAEDVHAGSKKTTLPQALFEIETRKKTRNQISPFLAYSGYVNLGILAENNIRRDDDRLDQRGQIASYFGLALRVEVTQRIEIFAHGQFALKRRTANGKPARKSRKTQLKEGLISFRIGDNGQLAIGRMRFMDTNKWVADTSVDGFHLGIRNGPRVLELALAEGTRKNISTYAIAHLGFAGARVRNGVFAIYEKDLGPERLHLSAYQNTIITQKFSHQWNGALVLGDAANDHSVGVGLDWRGIYKLKAEKYSPQITLGFAVGSNGFRQTGLHSNKTYDGGQTQFHRYGYVYQPELTNLSVATLAYGLRPSRKFSMDFTAHLYAQPDKSTRAPVARIKGKTTGRTGFLGAELSIVGGWRPAKKSKVEFGAAAFLPGSAYQDRSRATRLFVRYTQTF